MPSSLHAFPAPASRHRAASVAPPGAVVALAPAGLRSRAYAELCRLLQEDFGVEQDLVRPTATLADLGLGHFHWWALHEALLETEPALCTHPRLRDLDAIRVPLAELVRFDPAAAPS